MPKHNMLTDQIGFILENQKLFNINKNVIHHRDGLEEKNHMIISMNKVKNLVKFNVPHGKSSEEVRNKSNCPRRSICINLCLILC